MRGENPDETKVAQLTGELYDLESELDSKAGVAEIANRFACWNGQINTHGFDGSRGWNGDMMGW